MTNFIIILTGVYKLQFPGNLTRDDLTSRRIGNFPNRSAFEFYKKKLISAYFKGYSTDIFQSNLKI